MRFSREGIAKPSRGRSRRLGTRRNPAARVERGPPMPFPKWTDEHEVFRESCTPLHSAKRSGPNTESSGKTEGYFPDALFRKRRRFRATRSPFRSESGEVAASTTGTR